MLKKLTYSLFFALLLLQIGGLTAFYTVRQCLHQIAIWKNIENENKDVFKIKISKLNFENAKNNAHEFVFNQQLFDIKTVKIVGDSVQILAFRDREEEGFIEKIAFLFNTDTPQSNPNLPQKLVDFLKFAAICPDITLFKAIFDFTMLENCDFLPYCHFYTFSILKCIEIPPEMMLL